MTNPLPVAKAVNTNPLTDEYVNAVIQQHSYQSPETVIARLNQWIGLHGGENGVTLLMYEAHKALVKLRAPVADEVSNQTQEYKLRAMGMNYSARHSWDHLDRDCVNAAADEIRALRAALASAPVAGEADQPVAWRWRPVMALSDWIITANAADAATARRRGFDVESLYAAPQASEAVRDAEDAARWRWATASDGNADKLCSIVLCHGGYQKKIDERADFCRAALSAQPGAQKEQSDA